MIDLIAIDPGNEGGKGVCACAGFANKKLVALWYESAEDRVFFSKDSIAPYRFNIALEVPMMYPQGHERPNDLIKLAIAGALLAARMQPHKITQYTPAEWKKQKAKPACHLILWEKLSPAERALFPKDTEARILTGVEVNAPRMYAQPLKNYSFKAHNLLDAVGIGMHHMGLL